VSKPARAGRDFDVTYGKEERRQKEKKAAPVAGLDPEQAERRTTGRFRFLSLAIPSEVKS
jgi:hypothetical protein